MLVRRKTLSACVVFADKFVVYQYCGEVTIQFNDDEFFNKVKNSLIDHYPTLRRHLTSVTGDGPQYITDQCGHDVRLTGSDVERDVIHDVSLSLSDDGHALVVKDEGAFSWSMRDFQNICRNIAITAGTT